ncbi:MAG: MATE family efflux transporter [Oscillospiraceae bacterium]|nr:MATE family efflux transporter [Oscillospiraceae bacterium]
MNRSEERLGTAPLLKLVFSLGIPAVLAQLVNLLYSLVDKIYIGHIEGVGALALTGMGLCTPIILVVSAFAAFAGSGGAPLAAMELGRGDREKASRILNNAFLMLLAFSVVLSAALMCLREPLLRFFGASDDTISYADSYLRIYLCGTLFVQLSLGLNSFISCQGQAKTAMLSVLIGAVSNIILDPIFIFVFRMGVAGAAVATVISQAISAVWVLRFLISEKSAIRISARFLKPIPEVLAGIAALGISPFIMQSTESLISIVFQNGLQRYGGDIYVGTYTILSSVLSLMTFPVNGFAYGAQPIISYNYGAGDYSRVKKTYGIITAVCFAYVALFYVAVCIFPHGMAGAFTSDSTLAGLAASKLPLFLGGMVIFAFQMSGQVTLLGIGKTKQSLFLACLRKIILLTPLALILPNFFGVNGIYWAEPISDTISAVVCILIFVGICRKELGSQPQT